MPSGSFIVSATFYTFFHYRQKEFFTLMSREDSHEKNDRVLPETCAGMGKEKIGEMAEALSDEGLSAQLIPGVKGSDFITFG
jgi:hypothetical protein